MAYEGSGGVAKEAIQDEGGIGYENYDMGSDNCSSKLFGRLHLL